MKKLYLYFIVMIILTSTSKITINTKAANNIIMNEINDISLNDTSKVLTVSGWGFITESQHFLSPSTHRYTLNLKSKNHELNIPGVHRAISQTETMFFIGSRYCDSNEYNISATICNHRYENVGFNFNIPLDTLKMGEDYVASLKIDALNTKISRTAKVYFPNKNELKLVDKHNHYIMDSRLDDMSLSVVTSHALVRDTPLKGNNVIKSNLSCSLNKSTYFKQYSQYNSIYDKSFNKSNSTTYYKLAGNEAGCTDKRAMIVEGRSINPIWIASPFVKLSGEALTIKTREVNTPPVITIRDNPVIFQGDRLDLFDGVNAYDKEDGNLTSKIKIKSSNFVDRPGTYKVVYSVEDSFKAVTTRDRIITVLARNYPPVIAANDVTVKQYSNYNPLAYATARDQDNTDITSRIQSLSTIDTLKLGVFDQCYSVSDKYGLSAIKCIKVTVVKPETITRLIQKQRLFYKEDIPEVWAKFMSRLNMEINNEESYIEAVIKK